MLKEQQLDSEHYKLKWLTAFPQLKGQLKFKQQPEDFKVTEVIPFTLTDEGEHLWLWVEKTLTNTDWLAAQFAKFFEVPRKRVSYSGLKDKFATTKQWFSIHLPGQKQAENKLKDFKLEGITILEHHWHNKKLQIGTHTQNQFEIILRDNTIPTEPLISRFEDIKKLGVPNYFGAQRFGINGQNISQASAILSQSTKKAKRSQNKAQQLVISALRSYLFNEVLSQRVKQQTWNTILPGEAIQLNGQKGAFLFTEAKESSDTLIEKFKSGLCHPTGPLWGENDSLVEDQVLMLENHCFAEHQNIIELLKGRDLTFARRALRLMVSSLQYDLQNPDQIVLTFNLPTGCFATSVLTEISNTLD